MPRQSDIGPGRAHRVYGAILDSRRHTSILVRRDAGLAGLESVLPTLLDACREFAFSVSVQMARGWHGIGRTEHIFADYFGLRLLDAFPSAQLAQACRCYERGFKEAWGGDPHPGHDNSYCDRYVLPFADRTFASGHAALISAFFKAIHAYLLSPANRPAALLAQIKKYAMERQARRMAAQRAEDTGRIGMSAWRGISCDGFVPLEIQSLAPFRPAGGVHAAARQNPAPAGGG